MELKDRLDINRHVEYKTGTTSFVTFVSLLLQSKANEAFNLIIIDSVHELKSRKMNLKNTIETFITERVYFYFHVRFFNGV